MAFTGIPILRSAILGDPIPLNQTIQEFELFSLAPLLSSFESIISLIYSILE